MSKDILTVPELKKALAECREVLVQVRFGCSERWVKIPKYEARLLIEDLGSFGDDLTPQEAEMYSGRYGFIETDTLFLG